MKWEVDYYTGNLPLVTVTSQESKWVDLPSHGVVFVRVFFDDGKPRTMRMRGADSYFMDRGTFGFWTDVHQTYAAKSHVGNVFWFINGKVESNIMSKIPDVDPVLVKRGVMVPEYHANLLNLN